MARPKSKSPVKKIIKPAAPLIARPLLRWYDRHRRVLPWRAAAGVLPNAYHVWLSEIMLQQTTVAAVVPYFKKFLQRWPTVQKLAAAPLDEVLAAWAGLGYYSRARNLHACAGVLVRDYGARVPADEAALLRLPGIGRYTAAAIMAIAFNQRANVVDGNVERVMARVFAVTTPLPKAKNILTRLAAKAVAAVPARRCGDYAQALMDLGATVCTPKSPTCNLCPLQKICAAHRAGQADAFPKRAPKQQVPQHETTAYVVLGPQGLLLRRRAATGLLGGMVEVPHEGLRERAALNLPVKVKKWQRLAPAVPHVFSHFRLLVHIKAAQTKQRAALSAPYFWARLETLESLALPSVMQKVLRQAATALPALPRKGAV